MVTMQQIADRCGVSRGTVDRALHHKDGVREEVAERIRATAREMGLQPAGHAADPPMEDWRGAALITFHVCADAVRPVCQLLRTRTHSECYGDCAFDVRYGYPAPADSD